MLHKSLFFILIKLVFFNISNASISLEIKEKRGVQRLTGMINLERVEIIM